jgi:hypothetical protein
VRAAQLAASQAAHAARYAFSAARGASSSHPSAHPSDPFHFNTHFAVSWCLTWFTHTVPSLSTAARLFDLFLASNPLMPLYIGVAAMQACRGALLSGPCDAAEAHRTLSSLPPLSRGAREGGAHLGSLIRAARALAEKMPPAQLIAEASAAASGGGGAHVMPAHAAPRAWPFSDLAPPPRPDRVLKRLPRARAVAAAAAASLDDAHAGGGSSRNGRAFLAAGWGARVTSDGDAYAGQTRDGCRAGAGRCVVLRRGVRTEAYEGAWVDDARDGLGVNVWADGASYAGEWRRDRLHGFGVFTWPSGRVYLGAFRADKRHGLGVTVAPGGAPRWGAFFEDGREAQRLEPEALFDADGYARPAAADEEAAAEGAAAPAAAAARGAAAAAHAAAAQLRAARTARGLDEVQRPKRGGA